MIIEVLQAPLFRHFVIFLALAGLMVYCIDKSRQNKRTRQALYNCAYPLYGAAALKLLQIVDLLLPFHVVICQVVGLVLMLVAMGAYWLWLKPQDDIPFNKSFYRLGWIVLAVGMALQVAFLVIAIMQLSDAQA